MIDKSSATWRYMPGALQDVTADDDVSGGIGMRLISNPAAKHVTCI